MTIEEARDWVRDHLAQSEAADLFVASGVIHNDVHRYFLLQEIEGFAESLSPHDRNLLWPVRWLLIALPAKDTTMIIGAGSGFV